MALDLFSATLTFSHLLSSTTFDCQPSSIQTISASTDMPVRTDSVAGLFNQPQPVNDQTGSSGSFQESARESKTETTFVNSGNYRDPVIAISHGSDKAHQKSKISCELKTDQSGNNATAKVSSQKSGHGDVAMDVTEIHTPRPSSLSASNHALVSLRKKETPLSVDKVVFSAEETTTTRKITHEIFHHHTGGYNGSAKGFVEKLPRSEKLTSSIIYDLPDLSQNKEPIIMNTVLVPDKVFAPKQPSQLVGRDANAIETPRDRSLFASMHAPAHLRSKQQLGIPAQMSSPAVMAKKYPQANLIHVVAPEASPRDVSLFASRHAPTNKKIKAQAGDPTKLDRSTRNLTASQPSKTENRNAVPAGKFPSANRYLSALVHVPAHIRQKAEDAAHVDKTLPSPRVIPISGYMNSSSSSSTDSSSLNETHSSEGMNSGLGSSRHGRDPKDYLPIFKNRLQETDCRGQVEKMTEVTRNSKDSSSSKKAGNMHAASGSGTNPTANEFTPAANEEESPTTPTQAPIRGVASPQEFMKSFKTLHKTGFNIGGQKAAPRRIAFQDVPDWATVSDMLCLVHGGAVDRIFPGAGSEFIVQFCDEASCEQYAETYTDGIRVEHDHVIKVVKAPGSDKITAAFTSMIEDDASRLVRVSKVPIEMTNEELHKLAEGLTVDHILYHARAGCPGSAYFFFCGVSHGHKFLSRIQDEVPWDGCEVSFIPDPCKVANSFHGNSIPYQMASAVAV